MITAPTELAAARERNHAVWTRETELLFAKRVDEAFTHWHSDARYEAAYPGDGLPPVVEGHDVTDADVRRSRRGRRADREPRLSVPRDRRSRRTWASSTPSTDHPARH
jgi:hypothetical protein